jgi:Ca2+-transporting ATPase
MQPVVTDASWYHLTGDETAARLGVDPAGGLSARQAQDLLVGLYMAVVLDLIIAFGHSHYGSYAVGSSIGLTAFALMIVVSAYECRAVSSSILVSETFDNRTLNLTALGEIILAVLVTQMDAFHRILGTVDLSGPQFLLALAAAALVFVLWELGKLVARRA